MANNAYDVVVIGGGPGGYVCAIRAAQLGLKTLCVERAELGGVCLNWGCIPTKALIKTAELVEEVRHASDYGLKIGAVEWDFSKIVGRSREIVGRLNKGIAGLFKKYKVEHMPGEARLSDAHTVVVGIGPAAQKITAKNIVLATGARAKALPDLKPDGKLVVTSHEALIQSRPPKHLLVVGAGAIGLEFAYFYSVMGSRITVVEYQDSILPSSDREVTAMLTRFLAKRGIEIHTSSKLDKISFGQELTASIVAVNNPPPPIPVEADLCLLAVGLAGNVENLGLERLGIKVERGFIVTDPQCRTNLPHIFAIGDVNGPPLLAHRASFEGHNVAELLAGRHFEPYSKDQVPAVTYCQPQLASIGLTEEECKRRNLAYSVGRFPFNASGMALASNVTDGLVKLIFGKQHGELLGAHILSAHAADLIAEMGLALKLECTFEEVLATIHAHPTLSEALQEASGQAFGAAIHI